MNSTIRVVASKPALKPIVEPKYQITNAYVEKLEEDGEVKWILNMENHDGSLFKYILSLNDPK